MRYCEVTTALCIRLGGNDVQRSDGLKPSGELSSSGGFAFWLVLAISRDEGAVLANRSFSLLAALVMGF